MSQPVSISYVSKHVWGLYNNAIEEGGKVVKDLVKLPAYALYWTRYFCPSTPAVLDKANSDLRHMKNAISVIGVPYKLGQVAEKVETFWQKPSLQAAWNVVGKLCGLANECADTFDYVTTYVKVPAHVATAVSGVNYAATVVGAGKGVAEDIQELGHKQAKLASNEANKGRISNEAYAKTKANTTNAITLQWVNLASKAAYVALGVLGLAALAAGIAGTPMVVTGILTCLTVGTVLSLYSFFYERLVDPEGKTQNKYLAQLAAVQETSDALRV